MQGFKAESAAYIAQARLLQASQQHARQQDDCGCSASTHNCSEGSRRAPEEALRLCYGRAEPQGIIKQAADCRHRRSFSEWQFHLDYYVIGGCLQPIKYARQPHISESKPIGASEAMPHPVEMDARTWPRGAISALKPSSIPTKDKATKDKVQRLKDVFENNFRSITAPVKHNRVSVLLLSWDQKYSDIHVLPELEELALVFQNEYQFDVCREQLKESNIVELKLSEILSRFLSEGEDSDNLYIIYYAGHGFRGMNEGQLNITSNSSQRSGQKDQVDRNTIAWHEAERVVKRRKDADIFVIFDCCEAGALRLRSRSAPSHSFEFLGACDHDEFTPGPGKHSFTRALIWALRELKHTSPNGFDSVELSKKITHAPDGDRRCSPVLFSRDPTSYEHIWVYPKSLDEAESTQDSSRVSRKDRPPMDSLVLRFRFSKHQEEDQVKMLAEKLSQFVKEQRNCLGVHHIELIGYAGIFKDAVHTVIQMKKNGCHDTKEIIAAKDIGDEGKGPQEILLSEEQKSFLRSFADHVQTRSQRLILNKVALVVVSFVAGVFSTLFFWHQFFFLPHARMLQAWGYWGVSPGKHPMLGGAGACC